MAGLHFTSSIDTGYDKGLARMNKGTNAFAANTQKKASVINNSFKEIGTTIGGIASVAALAQAGKQVITFSADLQTSLTEVSTISGEVTDNFGKYKDALLTLSTESSTSAVTLSDAFYDVVSAGYDGAAGLELLTSAEKASTAGFVDVGVAADGLTTVLNAWGKTADEATGVSDIFFKTVEKGKTTFPELASNISQVAPLAASLGVSFEEVSAAAATITKSGVPTSQAFTQIRSALVGMNKTLGDGWAETMTLQEGFQAISDQAGGSSTKIQSLVGRVEGMNAVLALTGKNSAVAAADLEAMNSALGSTEIAAEKVTKTAANQAKVLANNILVAFEPLGTAAVETFATLAESLNEAFKAGDVEKYADILKTLVAAFAAWKVSAAATAQYSKLFGAEAVKAASLEHAAKLKTIQLEIAKQKEIISTAIIAGQGAKTQIAAINLEIQAKRLALTQAIASKNATQARAIQVEIATLQDQKSAATTLRKTTAQTVATAVAKTNTLQTNLQTAATKKGSVAGGVFAAASVKISKGIKGIGTAIAGNPMGLLITGLTLALPLIKSFAESLEKTDKLTEDLSEVTRKTATSLGNQTSALRSYQAQLQSTEPHSLQRKKIIEDLNKEYPDLLENIDIENTSMSELNGVFDSYVKNLEKTIRLKVLQSKFESLISEQEEANNLKTSNERYLALQAINQRKAALEDEITYQKNIVDVSQNYADLIKEQNLLLKDQEDTKILSNLDTQVQSYEDFVSTYKLLRSELINGEFTSPFFSKKQLDDAYVEYVNNQDNIVGTREDTANKLDDINRRIEEELNGTTVTTSKVVIKKNKASDNKGLIAALEISNQLEINKLTEQYAGKEKLEDEFNDKLLTNRLVYLTKLSALTTDELKKLKIEEEKLNIRAELNTTVEEIDEQKIKHDALLKEYETYTQKRERLIKEAQDKISLLDPETEIGNINEIQKELDKALKALDPKIEVEVDEKVNDSFNDTIDLLNNINELSDQFAESLGDATDESSILAKGILSAAGDTIGLVQAFKAVGDATTALETASGVLAVISIGLKIASTLNNALNDAQQVRIDNYIAEAERIQAVNIQLIKQNALYEEGNEFFSDDKWGTALNGLEAYNQALVYQKELLGAVASTFDSDAFLENGSQYIKILKGASSQTTQLGAALSSVAVKTKDRSGFSNLFGSKDQYKSLLDLYPELIDANGDLNTEILQTAINTEKLGEIDKANLENLLETTEAAQSAYDQFGDFISDKFGGVSDSITEAFQTMYEGGEDAMASLSDSFADMIESFTRDAIEFAFLQPLVEELNNTTKALGVDYAKGNIEADELSSNVIGALGDFYGSLETIQPAVLNAFNEADQLAAAQGFESAFNGDDSTTSSASALSSAGQVSASLTEETGSKFLGQSAATMLSNQIIADNSADILDAATRNLVFLGRIAKNTDYLPEIAENTRKMKDRL